MMRRLAPAGMLLLLSIPLFAQDKPQPAELAIQQALASFIHAFDNLDWETFRLAFDDNATVFYPRGFPDRATGRDTFEEKVKVVFQQIRNGKTKAPFMDIQPKDPHVQLFGDMAIVTFHLDDRAGFLNRRTIVLHQTTSGWKIIHLHASEVSTGKGQR